MGSIGHDLTTIELLVLWEAGGDNTIGNAYGAVQLYAEYESESELLDATQDALLRLFDLGLVRFVETTYDIGYTSKRLELPGMSRSDLLRVFDEDRSRTVPKDDTAVWYDPTPDGTATLADVPDGRIPRVSGTVRRPWLKPGERPHF